MPRAATLGRLTQVHDHLPLIIGPHFKTGCCSPLCNQSSSALLYSTNNNWLDSRNKGIADAVAWLSGQVCIHYVTITWVISQMSLPSCTPSQVGPATSFPGRFGHGKVSQHLAATLACRPVPARICLSPPAHGQPLSPLRTKGWGHVPPLNRPF